MHVVTLRDPSSPVAAQFVPEAGMIGVSLTDGEVELLGQRRGLEAYLTEGKTMGIPILYPWANRLGSTSYPVDGEVITLEPGARGVRADPNGLPIHGLLAGYRGWRVMREAAHELIAEVDFGADPSLLAGFPFPHLLVVRVELADRTLSVHTTVAATTDKAVPLCFGFHPYLRLPGVPRNQWRIETPAMRHLLVDERGLPTGESVMQPATSETLDDKAFDDGYDQVADGAVFAVSGDDRRIEVRFDHGFPAAQLFAPIAEDLVCFEPMAAPTDALRRGDYRRAQPGEPAEAQFSIRV